MFFFARQNLFISFGFKKVKKETKLFQEEKYVSLALNTAMKEESTLNVKKKSVSIYDLISCTLILCVQEVVTHFI